MNVKEKTLRAVALAFLAVSCLCPSPLAAHDIDPIVSTAWLAEHLNDPRIVMLDIRKVEVYREGHIPGSLSAYYGIWAPRPEMKKTELPPPDELVETIGDLGIGPDSLVVLVCSTYHCFYQVMAPRVLVTLLYAGLENVAILDGGYDTWVREGRSISTDTSTPKKTVYRGKVHKELCVTTEYVASRLGKATFVDVREPEVFSGKKKLPFVARAGRIPGAVNLPASAAYTERGTFKSKEELAAVAVQALGTDTSREIITYCDAGSCCPTWGFLLMKVLGYRNVKFYGGSFEEWSRDPALPVTP